MNTYLVKIYYKDNNMTKVAEYIFRCTEEEIEKYVRNELDVFKTSYSDVKVTDVMIFKKEKDYL